MTTPCWICGEPGATGEHLIKKSDLKLVFGSATQAKPLFQHSAAQTNFIVQSLNAKSLKLESPLCAKCNNARTQAHDRAWQRFSEHVHGRRPLSPGQAIRANRIYRQNANAEMRRVQLYFAKLFGCFIHQAEIPVPLAPFSKAILADSYHPDIYLRFGCIPRAAEDGKIVGATGLTASINDQTKQAALVQWFYELNGFAVHVIWAHQPRFWEASVGAWNPRQSRGRAVLEDFTRPPQKTG